MFRKILAALGLIILLSAVASTAYYWNEIRVARADTQRAVAQAYEKYGRQVSVAGLSPQHRQILLKIEDPAFDRHHGVDLQTPGAGMTTITQGLVKLLYFPDGFKPGIRKIRQTLIAEYALDDLVSKQDQLELYLNITYFGSVDGKPVHGLESAAQTYFSKGYTELSEQEFIALIGMTISPNNLKPGTAESATRVARIERYLSGEVQPGSVLDVEYTGKKGGRFAEEMLMAFLRLVTDADPAT